MGLFSFGKKKKAKEPDTKERAEQEALKFLEDFNKENGNYASSFYFAHKKEADRHETQVVNARVLARDAKDHRERLKALQECKKNLDDFCAWCHKYKYGDLYYQEWIGGRPGVPSYYESLVEDLNREQRIEDYIIPAIMEKVGDGVYRTDLMKQFDELDKSLVSSALNELEKNKLLKKDKVKNKVYFTRG